MWSSHSAHSSQSSSTLSIRKPNDSSADNSVKELSSEEEEDNTPTPTPPVNESFDEIVWNDSTQEPQLNRSQIRHQSNSDIEDKAHQSAQRFIGPQLQQSVSPHSCCHCTGASFDNCLSTSRVLHMSETTNRFMPSIVAKRNYRVCDHCGLTCAHMYFEPMASSYWDHVVPHHHNLHQNFHYRKVFSIYSIPVPKYYLIISF